MSTEGAIEAAYRRARGEFADAEDMVAEEVEARRALRPPAANTTSVSRAEATARLHKGVPVSPGVASSNAYGGKPTGGGPPRVRPATAAAAGAAAATASSGFSSKTFFARAGAVSVPLMTPGSPAVALARSAAAAAMESATDPAKAHDDELNELSFDRGPKSINEPDRRAKQNRERLPERPQSPDPPPADRRPRPV